MEKLNKRVIILLSQNVREMLEEQFKKRDDVDHDVVFHYKTLIENLPLIDTHNFNCKKNEDSDWENDDYPNTQNFL